MVLSDLAALILSRATHSRRFIVAITGAPGSGKSTVSERLVAALGPSAAIVPMDGYHMDNAILDARGWRARKGAPYTFDVAGLAQDLARVRADQGDVFVPVFDRALDLSRGSARAIGAEVRIVLVEGNYLLLSVNPWPDLAGQFDLTVRLDVPYSVLETRLSQRWLDLGLDLETARARVQGNDLPNARQAVEQSRDADLVLKGY